jgi:hypothetical protein
VEVHRRELVGAELTVRSWGNSDGTPALFLHSLGPAASAAFVNVPAGPLAARGLHLVAASRASAARPSFLRSATTSEA